MSACRTHTYPMLIAHPHVRTACACLLVFTYTRGTDIKMEHSHKSWRPLTTISFALNRMQTGLDPMTFHAGSSAVTDAISTVVRYVLPRQQVQHC